VAGDGAASVLFGGTVRLYDALDPATWAAIVVDGPSVAAATMRFGRKNARYVAGYAVDAPRVPLAWTPPGRVLARVVVDRSAVVDAAGVHPISGGWDESSPGAATSFAPTSRDADGSARLAAEIERRLGSGSGDAVVAVDGPSGLLTLPVRWTSAATGLYAALPSRVARLGLGPDGQIALAIDRRSTWRARSMIGVLVRGDARSWAVASLELGAGAATQLARAAGVEAGDAVVVRVRPRRVTWWSGWSTASARPGGAA
jgi:hypothetical protein